MEALAALDTVFLVLGILLVVAAIVAYADANRRRGAAIDLLKERNPGQWRHLDREGGQHALRKWSEKDPESVDDAAVRAVLQGARRSKQWTDRLLLPGVVLLGLVALMHRYVPR
jgi:hypothetical protein